MESNQLFLYDFICFNCYLIWQNKFKKISKNLKFKFLKTCFCVSLGTIFFFLHLFSKFQTCVILFPSPAAKIGFPPKILFMLGFENGCQESMGYIGVMQEDTPSPPSPVEFGLFTFYFVVSVR